MRAASRPGARSKLPIVAGAALLAALVSCGGGRPAPESSLERSHLNIGLVSLTATYLPLYLAADDGYFADEGLQVDLLTFRGGSDLIKALVAGSIDVGVVSLAEVVSGIDAGQPLRAFYAGFNVPAFAWYAVPSIRTIADAKGKRFGVTQFGSSTDFLTRYAIAARGLDPARDVQIVQGGDSPTRLAAMEAGQIDVNVFAAPDTFIAEEHGFHRLFSQKDLAPDYPYHVFVTTEGMLAGAPRTIRALLRAHVSGLRRAKADKPHAEEALLRRIPMDRKYVGPTYDDLIAYEFEDGRLPSDEGLAVFFDMGIKAGRVKERWPKSRYWVSTWVDSYDQWQP